MHSIRISRSVDRHAKNRSRSWKAAPVWALPAAFLAFAISPALAGTGVTVETVNHYGVPFDLPNSKADGDGFMNTITQDGLFTRLDRWTEDKVIDSDFTDDDLDVRSHDTTNFDQPSEQAISWFTGHGVANAGVASQPCSNDGQCARPPADRTDLRQCGRCVYVQSQATGTCHYSAPRYLVVSSIYDAFGGYVVYNNFYGNKVAWGESPTAGAWRNAGTNGGTNLVVLGVSNGAYVSSVLPDLAPGIAGVHMIATVMPTDGDTANVSDRGSVFATQMLINHNGSVASAWVNLMNTLSAEDGGSCAAPGGGGGRGINGCGGNVVIAVGATPQETTDHIQESWIGIQDDSKDTTGIAYWTSLALFNYDTVLNPPLHDDVNTPPAVNAGPDQTITLPATASLAGTATDDGLPCPSSTVTQTWSVVSGPGPVTFANPAALATTATFSVAGMYVLRLTATDGALSATDDVTVVVNPAPPINTPPVVNAGPDQTITLPATASLAGTATDDGLPNPPNHVTPTWSKVSGPGTVTFANPGVLATTAAFSMAGSYTLRLTGNDSQLSGSDDVVITVLPATTSPCDGLCTSPVNFTIGANYQSGNLGTGTVCRQTTSPVHGGNCSNFASPRNLKVNGVVEPCNSGNWASVPAARNGGYCIQVSAGNYSYAAFALW